MINPHENGENLLVPSQKEIKFMFNDGQKQDVWALSQ